MKHSAIIRHDAARLAARQADGACAHWDYENEGGMDYECCRVMRVARDELRLAKKARMKEQQAAGPC